MNAKNESLPEPMTASMCPSPDYAKGWNDCLAALTRHPDALEDGSLSKSTAKRVDALRLAQGEEYEWLDCPLKCADGACKAKNAGCGSECPRPYRKKATQQPHHDRGEEVPPMEDDPERPDGPGLPEARGELTKAALAWGRDVSNYALARKMTIATGTLEIAAYNAGFAAALTEAKQQGPAEVVAWIGPRGELIDNERFQSRLDGLPDFGDLSGYRPLYTAPQVEAKK